MSNGKWENIILFNKLRSLTIESGSNIDLKNSSTRQQWRGPVLICRQALHSGMNSLQPMTIHTSIQFRPSVATRKPIQMYVLQAQSALPRPPGRRFSSRASHCYSLPVNRSCTQVVTFLYGRRSLCSGTAPEGKAEVDYQTCKTN